MIESLARLGYASKALIYAMVGGLAAAAAVNRGGRVTDRSGALRLILSQPFGDTILIVLAVGLCGYAAWRIIDAFFDPERRGTSLTGLVARIGSVVRGGIYGMVGVESFRLARGLRGSDGREAEMWAARIMHLPFGEWLLGIAGAIVVAYGATQIATAVWKKDRRSMDLTTLSPSLREPLVSIARFGVAARAVIIVVLGVFLVRAAVQQDPSEAAGTRESMLELARIFQGRWVLTAMALGLIAYGVDQALRARYRRIRSPI